MFSSSVVASIKFMTLNMHGFHPMDEAIRYIEKRDGSIKRSSSYLYYFTREELARGHEKRIDQLAHDISILSPDVLALQEVVAGPIDRKKNCSDFYKSYEGSPTILENTALQLEDHLNEKDNSYISLLACRGNTGWQTNDETFRNKRIVKYSKIILKKAIDFGGSSIRDFKGITGKSGNFQSEFKVYDRAKKRCSRNNCFGQISRKIISNRSTFICSVCQK